MTWDESFSSKNKNKFHFKSMKQLNQHIFIRAKQQTKQQAQQQSKNQLQKQAQRRTMKKKENSQKKA